MKGYENILFDLDGTLTDSAPGILNCVQNALSVMGISEPENIMRFVGPPLYESFASFCGMNEEQVIEAVRLYRERYTDIGLFENSVYDGVPEMLERLKNGGRRLFVATSKPEVFAVRILDRFGLSDFFEVIGGADIVGSRGSRNEKDEVIEYVLEQAGQPDRSTVLMIGDRKHDIIGAEKCGVHCMAALWGYGSEEEFYEYGADYIAKTPQEAADMILGTNT